MREFHTQDGTIIHLPDDKQRAPENCYCSCHVRMGNDFYFLPIGSCLRDDRRCDHSEKLS